jgi:formylglycine-generating enzyme required for sulfatase activity
VDDDDAAPDLCGAVLGPLEGLTLSGANFTHPVVCLEPGWGDVEGEFVMGSLDTEIGHEGGEVQHPVTITRTLIVGVHELPQHVFERITGLGPANCLSGCGADLPMHGVTWTEALAFCNTLSGLDGLEPAYDFSKREPTWNENADGWRLPTEAEWEWLARGGEDHPFSGSADASVVAHCDIGIPVREVGTQLGNAWTLQDMSGNVDEWVWDRFGPYSLDPQEDPMGPELGDDRVLRGGSVVGRVDDCRVARRGSAEEEETRGTLGFRVVRTVTP